MKQAAGGRGCREEEAGKDGDRGQGTGTRDRGKGTRGKGEGITELAVHPSIVMFMLSILFQNQSVPFPFSPFLVATRYDAFLPCFIVSLFVPRGVLCVRGVVLFVFGVRDDSGE